MDINAEITKLESMIEMLRKRYANTIVIRGTGIEFYNRLKRVLTRENF